MLPAHNGPSTNGHVSNGDAAGMTVADVIEIYLRHSAHGQSKEAHVNRQYILRRFCETHGSMRIADSKPFHLKLWIDGQTQLKSGWSRKNHCGAVQACFNWAAKLGVINANPFRGVFERGGKRGRPIRRYEFRAMIRAATDKLFRRLVLFLRYTGARPCEAAKARWSDVQWESGKIILDQHKTDRFGEPRVIYLLPSVVRMLLRIRREKLHKEFIFVNRWGNPWKNTAISWRLKYIRRVTGIPNDATLYCYRHGFCTEAILAGNDVVIVAKLAGHRRIETTRTYIHLHGEDEHLHGAVEKTFKRKKAES